MLEWILRWMRFLISQPNIVITDKNGELSNLKQENIDLEAKMIIVKYDTFFSTISRKDRIIHISKKVLEIFQKKESTKHRSASIFTKDRGIKFNNNYFTNIF